MELNEGRNRGSMETENCMDGKDEDKDSYVFIW